MTTHHNDQRQIWISERHRDMLRELADAEQRNMRVVAERLIEEAHEDMQRNLAARKKVRKGKRR